MCGISGIYSLSDEPASLEELLAMRDSLVHRGPDDAGVWAGRNIALGFRRLSIIDLQTGNQPLFNEDGSVVLVFNGEIYNYDELRRDLETRHVFRTKTDSETIVHLYEELGEAFVHKLNGMFAIAIWDEKKQKLILARDRTGEKPLYYARSGSTFYFASEMKAFLPIKRIAKRLRSECVPEFLAFGNLYGPNTLLRDVHEILPAHIAVVQASGIETRQYWDDAYEIDSQRSLSDNMIQLEELLADSVRMRLMSDVRLGAFLSGGVDSSLVVALMSRFMSEPVQTFSVGFKEKQYSELGFAQEAAGFLHTDHHELVIDDKQFFDAIPQLIYFQDHPINHYSAVPLYYLAKYAKNSGVTVLLSGEGGDELFGGYDSYRAFLRDIRFKSRLPNGVWQMASRVLRAAGSSKYANICERYSDSLEWLAFGNSSILSRSCLRELAQVKDIEGGYFFSMLDKVNSSWLAKVLYTHLRTRLVTLLMKQDKMTMASSIECRVPMLDHRIVEFAGGIDDAQKIRDGECKYILKKVAEKYLPKDLIYRQKMGFPVPLASWLRQNPACTNTILDDRSLSRGLTDATVIRRMVKEHTEGKANHTSTIWNLINLELWIRMFVEGEHPSSITPMPAIEAVC
jgi:asparagine synthase (glutamine-hydrolysing)